MNDKLYLNLTHGINNAWINIGLRGITSGDRYWPRIAEKLKPKDKDGNRPYWND